MTSSTPKVTVLIPTYNWSSVLPYSVGSVLRQTCVDFEVLVVGDGCTDDSEAVVNRLGDPRVRWVNLPTNTGHQSAPNNEGLKQARGNLIAYLGHDDLWLPHHLACLVDAISKGADLAFAITEMVGPDGYREVAPHKFGYSPGLWIPPTGIIHRREIIDHIGPWRNPRELRTDPEVDLWHRAHAGGHSFAFAPRLTAVKFPAAWRRHAYKNRACHEQAAWFERMRSEADFEAVELGELLQRLAEGRTLRTKPYRELILDLLRETVRRSKQELSLHQGLPGWGSKGRRFEMRRRFKGLPPQS